MYYLRPSDSMLVQQEEKADLDHKSLGTKAALTDDKV